MPKRVIDVRGGAAWLDIVSYGRGGAGRAIGLSRGQIEQITRTVGRTPEVMIKVLPKDSNNAGSVQKHIDYIGRKGELELETDDGSLLQGKGIGKELLEDWDLDLETHRRESDFAKTRGRAAPKLVHKLMFSMPPGTPASGVLAAAQNFAREEFALKHRYVMVLHTDEPHPHVHMIVKAVSELGVRLNIRKATLREWRSRFAHYLRQEGVAANATDRFVRGETKSHKLDGIYRPMRDPRRYSTRIQEKVESVATDLMKGTLRVEPGKSTLAQTRREVERGWRAVLDIIAREERPELAGQVERFVAGMQPPQTDNEQIAEQLRVIAGRSRNAELQPGR